MTSDEGMSLGEMPRREILISYGWAVGLPIIAISADWLYSDTGLVVAVLAWLVVFIIAKRWAWENR